MTVLGKMTSEISTTAKLCLALSSIIMLSFFTVQTLVIFKVIPHSHELDLFGYICVISFMPLFTIVVREFLKKKANVEKELIKKNTYLEHSAKILRHDMHSGINVYMPRGISSLERRLTPQQIKDLKIGPPLRMIKEGLKHTQKVYKGVYEFTNLVKKNAKLEKTKCSVKEILDNYLHSTSYSSQVILNDNLPTIEVNESLFCTAIDNLIRNSLKYNDSETKIVKVYQEGKYICIEDNGRGMSQEEFEEWSKPYIRKHGQIEQGSGLGLNICNSILEEHGFKVSVEKLNRGMSEFYKDLLKLEGYATNAPTRYSFEKEELEKKALEDNYKGKLITKRGGRNTDKVYVIYKEGTSTKNDSRGTKMKIKI